MIRHLKILLSSMLIRLLAASWRLRLEHASELPDRCVVAFWHEDMLAVWKYFATQSCAGVTSLSKDGDYLAAILQTWTYTVIRGSSSKGGHETLEQMVQAAATTKVLVTPDGPRGPRRVFKAGAAVCAQRARVPLVVIEVQISRAHRLEKSWDKFSIPLPFSRVTLRVKRVINIDANADRDAIDAILRELSDAEL